MHYDLRKYLEKVINIREKIKFMCTNRAKKPINIGNYSFFNFLNFNRYGIILKNGDNGTKYQQC